jgi:hypothetical protein
LKITRRSLLALALALVLTLSALGNTFYNRQCSVTGGSAQQLSAVLTTAGYAGPLSLQELTIVNPSAAANDLYFGQSDVSTANGVKLSPGDSYTMRATNQTDQIDATRIYLYTASTQNAAVILRSK